MDVEQGQQEQVQATEATATETPAVAETQDFSPQAPVEQSVFSDNAGNDASSWTDSLPEALKASPHLKSFKSANDVIKSYIGLCTMAGKKGLMPPPEGATQVEKEAYLMARRGGIDSPEAYSTKYDAVKPYGLTEETYKSMCKDFFEAGLSDREQVEVMKSFARMRQSEHAAWVQENNSNCQQALMQAKHEWGLDYDSKMAGIKALMNSFPEAKKAFEATGVQNNFHVLQLLATFATATKEFGSPKSTGQAVDAKSIDAQLKALTSSAAYKDPSSPGYKAAMEQFWALCEERANAK